MPKKNKKLERYVMEALIAKLATWAGGIFPAAIGSAISLYVRKEKAALMTKVELLAVFMFGIFLAHYLGGAAIEYGDIDPHSLISDAIKLTVGLLGMAVLAEIMTQLPLAIAAIRKKWLGE